MNAPIDPALGALRFGSGHTVRRLEDPTLITGQGRFTDDLQREGLTHLVFVRSPHAHARILSIDVSPAVEMDGVLAVITGADLVAQGVQPMAAPPAAFTRPDGQPAATAPRRAMAHEAVRFVGEAVAAVVARSREVAVNAAEAVWVDYEVLPAAKDVAAALAADAPRLCDHAPDNVVAEKRHGNAAACEAAFAAAAHVVALDLVNQRLAPSAIEPRVVMAEPEAATGRLLITLSSQMPTAVRDGVATLLPGLSKEQVRVTVGDVGGGFGMKTGLYPEDLVVAFAARQLGVPVRWRSTRLEEFMASVHGRDLETHAELALDAHGRILALRERSFANVGGYATPTGVAIPSVIGPFVATSVYDIPTIDLHITTVLCNTTPVGAYRGAGRPEAIYIIERLLDAAAHKMGVDPAELRRRNLVRPDQMPYTNGTQLVYDSGEFEKMLDQVLALGDWKGFPARLEASKQQGRLRGRSVTTFLEWTGGNALSESVKVHVRADGIIELISATMPMGQGIATSYAQLAVDVFGVPIDRIRILQGDTDRANGFGSAGSRSLFTGGGAVQVASERTVAHAKSLASEALEAAESDIEYREGTFRVVGTDLQIGLFELASRQSGARITASGDATAGAPSWPNAAHTCEVEIDPDSGEVSVVEYASVSDIGRIVSPQIVEGQVEGGAIQGMGQALCERVVYDDAGQLLTASFMDYALPKVDGFRKFKTAFDTSVPCKTNLLGAKGVGELGTIGATPAVVNAVMDALIRSGVAHERAWALQMPLTADKVWAVLHDQT
ncbi:MAG: hypothetical protein RI949_2356 [Pseudomonadota bacterium]